MQEGWYYRSLANEELNKAKILQDIEHMDVKYEDTASEDDNPENSKDQNVSTSSSAVNYKSQYRFLKRKLKFLIYENEFFQDALRSNQRRLLKVSRDRAFLLDRLLQYEKPDDTSSGSEETESSEEEIPKDSIKRRKVQEPANSTITNSTTSTTTTTTENGNVRGRKRKTNLNTTLSTTNNEQSSNLAANQIQTNETMTHSTLTLGAELEVEEEPLHISAAEVERHLQSKPPMLDLLTERAPATVPTEMFSVDQ